MKVSKGLIMKNKYDAYYLICAKEKLQKGNRSIKMQLIALIDKLIDDMF